MQDLSWQVVQYRSQYLHCFSLPVHLGRLLLLHLLLTLLLLLESLLCLLVAQTRSSLIKSNVVSFCPALFYHFSQADHRIRVIELDAEIELSQGGGVISFSLEDTSSIIIGCAILKLSKLQLYPERSVRICELHRPRKLILVSQFVGKLTCSDGAGIHCVAGLIM